MKRYLHWGKKHPFDPVFVFEIQQDRSYYLLFFAHLFLKTTDLRFQPKRRKSGDITFLCPLHEEKTPSLRINAENNCYKCFGCGSGGDILNLLQEYYSISFIEAIKKALSFKRVPDGTKLRMKSLQNPNQITLGLSDPKPLNLDDDLPF